jgi:molybdate transport system substrate-binding protein
MADDIRPAATAGIRIFATLAVMGAMREITARYEALHGVAVVAEFAPTNGIIDRIRSGDTADIAIMTAQAVDDLIHASVLAASRVDVARSLVGMAVKAGAPRPDIGSIEALKATLLATPSIAYSRIGTSGIFFADLIERLGIAEPVNAKATIIPSGFTAELAASGQVALAVQQVSELLVVPGIDVVGELPADIQPVTMFSAGVFRGSAQPAAAGAFVRFLSSATAAPILEASGLRSVA